MINIREAKRDDCGALVKLSSMESGRGAESGDAGRLGALMFDLKLCGALIGYDGDVPFAMCLYRYTAHARALERGVYLEDVFVAPDHRGGGIGKFILQLMAQKVQREGCAFLEWDCGDPRAREFCAKADAPAGDARAHYFLAGDALGEFGKFKCSCCGEKRG